MEKQIFECNYCGFYLQFNFDEKKNCYVSTCPYCGTSFEIEKEEYEKDREYYFEPDF